MEERINKSELEGHCFRWWNLLTMAEPFAKLGVGSPKPASDRTQHFKVLNPTSPRLFLSFQTTLWRSNVCVRPVVGFRKGIRALSFLPRMEEEEVHASVHRPSYS
jgi:hypothetical protein